MAGAPRSVNEAIARFDETVARWDGATPQAIAAKRRHLGRSARSVAKRLGVMGAAIVALLIATIVFGSFVGPIGTTGLFVVALAILGTILLVSLWPGGSDKPVEYNEQLPTGRVIQQLESLLVSERDALPPPAARQADAISAQLPLLESRLGELDPFDPLAQDARRLMGKHLPELIERYERVPAAYRRERDGGGLTVDERLTAGLGAAREALSDIGAQMAKRDRDALETQGRFIESRYRDSSGLQES